jgi:hypothetical protein
MVSLLSSRHLANEVLENRIRRIPQSRKLPWIALYGLFTSPLLLGKIAECWNHHQAITFTEILFSLSLGPFFIAFLVLSSWLGNRYMTYPLVFRIDGNGLTTPTGRLLEWSRPTSCEMVRDQHVTNVYHLYILTGKRVIHDLLLDDPSKATPFIAEFKKFYGSHGSEVEARAAQSL